MTSLVAVEVTASVVSVVTDTLSGLARRLL